jgi:inosose dehydratase
VEESLPRLAATGYRGVELSVIPGFNTELYSLNRGRKKLIRELLDEHGLALTAVAGHRSILSDDAETLEGNLQRLRDAIDLAAELAGEGETPIMVSLVGGRPDQWDTHRQAIVERIGRLVSHAAQRGVVYAVEPHTGTAMDLPSKVVWLLDQIDSPMLRLNFDISHMDVMGIGIDECVPVLAPLSVLTHVKDQRGLYPNHEFLTPGEGPFDYVHYLKAMRAAGYDGFIMVEVSMMRQRQPDYEPFDHAALGYRTLAAAFRSAGIERPAC